MVERSLYERVLARVASGAGPPEARPPRPSAAVVPWRRSVAGELEVFWMRRADSLAFMGGWHAFPGGGVARGDAEATLAGEPQGAADAPADAGAPASVIGDLDLGQAVTTAVTACALRELAEETGIEAEPSHLVFAGRWLTPPLGPVRFDTRFFLLEWPAERAAQPSAVSSECAEVEWIRPAAALERWSRGEVITAPPILHLLRVLGEDGPETGLARLRNPVEANLGPHRRIEFQPGVLTFPLQTPTLPPATHTNSYLLGARELVLIDPGSPFEPEIDGLLAAISTLAAEGRKTTAIWLTHHHPDHVGGVDRVRRALGVPVSAHPATAERLRPLGIEVDAPLEDDQRIILAGEPEMTVRVLHTPGHARGHLCFLEERTGALLAGDMIAGIGTIVIDPPEGDMDDYLASLERLERLDARTLFPAHGPTIRGARAKLHEYIDHRLWREERILEAWRSGLRELDELLPRVYDDTPKIAHPLARRQLQAHLDRLYRRQRL